MQSLLILNAVMTPNCIQDYVVQWLLILAEPGKWNNWKAFVHMKSEHSFVCGNHGLIFEFEFEEVEESSSQYLHLSVCKILA